MSEAYVDTCLLLPYLFDTYDHEQFRSGVQDLIDREGTLRATEPVAGEMLAQVQEKVIDGELSEDLVRKGAGRFANLTDTNRSMPPVQVVPIGHVRARAYEIASELSSVDRYLDPTDAFILASTCAFEGSSRLYTADTVLTEGVRLCQFVAAHHGLDIMAFEPDRSVRRVDQAVAPSRARRRKQNRS